MDREQIKRDLSDVEWAGVRNSYWPDTCRALLAELEQAERERDELGPLFIRDCCRILGVDENDDLHMDKIASRLAKVPALVEALRQAINVSAHLMQMIPRNMWRDEGGDDGQGHYEGDYRAARIMDDIREWREALAAWETE